MPAYDYKKGALNMYRDTDFGGLYTEEELREIYNENLEDDPEVYADQTFEEYLAERLTLGRLGECGGIRDITNAHYAVYSGSDVILDTDSLEEAISCAKECGTDATIFEDGEELVNFG